MTITPNKATGRQYARLKTGNPAQPYVRLSLKTKSAAEAKRKAKDANLAKIEAAMQAGSLTQATVARLTVGRKLTAQQAAEQWFAGAVHRDESPSTTAKNRAVLSQWFAFAPGVSGLPPSAVTEEHISPFVNRVAADVGYATRQRQLSVIRQFLRYCADIGAAQGNAARRLQIKHRELSHEQLEPAQRQPFTEAEVKRILAHTEGWDRWSVGIAYATGMRLGDVAQLEHASLAMPGHIAVWLDKHLRRVCLPINERLTPGLAGILAEIPPADSPYLFPEQARQYEDIPTGRPKFSVYFGRILKRLGIENRSFHSLRHTALSRWAKLGFNLEECRDFAGHANTKTTKGYIHD